MKKKSILTFVLALVMVFAVCLPLTACGNGYSETFTGTLSEESYSSEENAVKAFLDVEIASEQTNQRYL